MRDLIGAAGAERQVAPAAPRRPLRERVLSFVRPECGVTPTAGPSTSPLASVLWLGAGLDAYV